MQFLFRSGCRVFPSLIIAIVWAASAGFVYASTSVTLGWNPSPDQLVAGYNLYYGNRSGVTADEISPASYKGTTVSNLTPGVTYYFAVTAYDRNGLESLPSAEISYTVPLTAASPEPTLNPISNYYLTANASSLTVGLTGISPGLPASNSSTAGQKKSPKKPSKKAAKIKIKSASSNRKLLPPPIIRYATGSSTATLTFKLKPNTTGTATVTVTVNNGAKSHNLISRSFTVTVLPAGETLPAALTPAVQAGQGFALNLAGVSGQKYIVQASTNLIDWVPVQTNAAPFTFTDTHSGEFSRRFYRSVPVP